MNVYGDPIVVREMLEGPFNLLDIGTSITVLMSSLWAKMFIGAVPYGGRFQRPLGDYLAAQGFGSSAAANYGAGGNFLPTSNYSLTIALEGKSSGFTVPADGPVFYNLFCETGEIGSVASPTGNRGFDVPGNGAYNWLRGPSTLRGLYYGSGNDWANAEQWTMTHGRASAGVKVPVPAAGLGVYHYVDSAVGAEPLTVGVQTGVKFVPGSTSVNNRLLSVLGFRLFSNDPHWEYCGIARAGSVVDDFIDTAQISAAAWANILPMLGTTHVVIDQGVNEDPAHTQQDFYDRLVTLIGRVRQDNPTRRVVLMSCYAVPTYEAKLIRNAAAMLQVAEQLPFVAFLDVNAEFPDSAWNNANILVDGLHPNDEGKTIVRAKQIDLLHRLAGMTIPVSSDPSLVAGYVDLLDTLGAPAAGGQIEIQRTDTIGNTGTSVLRGSTFVDADSSGRVTVNVQANKTFRARREGGPWASFTAPSSGTFALPLLLGQAP